MNISNEAYTWVSENTSFPQHQMLDIKDLDSNELAESKFSNHEKMRALEEAFGFGPLRQFMDDVNVTEVLVNSYDEIFFERNGFLEKADDHFLNEQSYLNFIERLSNECQSFLSREKPFVEKQWGLFRITIVYGELSSGHPVLSIRKKSALSRTLQDLQQLNFLSQNQYCYLKELIQQQKNILVIGPTGSGKTTLLQALLNETDPLCRTLIIEDTQELSRPHRSCLSLLTRPYVTENLPIIDMEDLIKRALRLRPDRLVIGEIRGPEAKSLLMALSTGHNGSMGSLHANDAYEALFRLEMLIQMGAPQWSLTSIRRLLSTTVDYILTADKINGHRTLKSIHQICSYEETGLTLEEISL